MRNIGTINLKIGLVNIPLSVNSFLDYSGIHLKQLCPACEQPIRYKRWCESCNKEVEYSDLKKGYQLTKNEIIVIPKDLDMDLETKIVSVIKTNEEFEFLQVKCYLLTPKDDVEKPYHLLKNLLSLFNVSLVIEYSLRKKLHLGIIKVVSIDGNSFLMLKQILYADRIKTIKPIPNVPVSEEEIELGKELFKTIRNNLKGINYLEVKDKRKEMLGKILKGEVKPAEVKVEKEEDMLKQLKASVKPIKVRKKKKKVKVSE